MLPGGFQKTQIFLMIYPLCTHAVRKLVVLVNTHVFFYSNLPGQSSRQRMLMNAAAMKWSVTFDRVRGEERDLKVVGRGWKDGAGFSPQKLG